MTEGRPTAPDTPASRCSDSRPDGLSNESRSETDPAEESQTSEASQSSASEELGDDEASDTEQSDGGRTPVPMEDGGVTNSNEVSPGPPSPSEVTDYSEQATDRESYSIDHYAEETDSGSQLTRFTGMWFVETGREPNGYQDQTRSDTETEAEQSVNPDNE